MENERLIYVPMGMEYLFRRLFGNHTYYQFVGVKRPSDWKKSALKLTKTMKLAVEANVETNALHKARLLQICDLTRRDVKEANGIDAINMGLIEGLTKLVFELLGDMPNNSDMKVVNKPNHFLVRSKRTLLYHQSPEQKVDVILSLANDHHYKSHVPSYIELRDKLWFEYAGAGEFINWFKSRYPDVYADVF